MHIHLPKPLHGWREFLGEVGIIVIGVLIALGAEQVIEDIRWQEKQRTSLPKNCTMTRRAHTDGCHPTVACKKNWMGQRER